MRFKLNLLLFLVVTVVLLVSSMFSYFSLRADLTEGYESRKLELAKRLQVNLANALWNYDENQAASVIEAELDSPDVMAIYVFQKVGEGSESAAGSLLAFRSKLTADPNARGGGGGQLQNEETVRVPLHETFPTTFANRPKAPEAEAGHALITFSRARLNDLLGRQLLNLLIEIIVLNLVIGFALFSVVSRLVIAPLAQLSLAFKDLAKNPQGGELEIKCEDEFGEIVEAFNQIERRLTSDIERRDAAEKELIETNSELTRTLDTLTLAQESLVQSEKFASLGSLVAGVAHEINTPVGVAVTGASFLLEESKKIEGKVNDGTIKKSEFLNFIDSVNEGARLVLSNTERAAHLIQSFKQVAADETSEARRSFELDAYLSEVLTSLRPKFKKTGIAVDCNCPADIQMDTYPGLLAQVLTNLITNALRHGYNEGDRGRIEIRARRENEWVIIECANDGKPIPPEHLSKIFEPFFTTKRSEGGTGLGLNIVFNIVTQRLGGTVRVRSDAATGTCFTLRIPQTLAEKSKKDH